MLWSTILVAALASVASARKCRDIDVHVTISAENGVYDLEPLVKVDDVTNFYLHMVRQGANYPAQLQTGTRKVTGTYKLATTYCEPDDGPGEVLQLMTHGVAFDRQYWDVPLQRGKYSYVERAVDEHGYSTLTWDRLGVGESSRADTISELQMALEVEALRVLTNMAAEGKIDGVGHAYDSIVHVGHSFGSGMTYNLVSQNPGISKGIVLTGFSHVSNFSPLFIMGTELVPVSQTLQAWHYPPGYVGSAGRTGVHNGFFGTDDFDPHVLTWTTTVVTPHGPGEFLSIGLGAGALSEFEGPVMIITGDRDLPFCGADCMATDSVDPELPNLLEISRAQFPKASDFNATVVPNAGHGLNLGYSAPGAYNTMFAWLESVL